MIPDNNIKPLHGDFMDSRYLPDNFEKTTEPKKDDEFWWCDTVEKSRPQEMG